MTWVYEIESGVMVRTMADYLSFSIIILNLTGRTLKPGLSLEKVSLMSLKQWEENDKSEIVSVLPGFKSSGPFMAALRLHC